MASAEQCETAENIANSPFYPIVIVKMLIAIAGTILSIYTFKREGIKWLVHPNAKIIFCNHAILTVLTAIAYVQQYAFEVYRISFPGDQSCPFVMTGSLPFFRRLPGAMLFALQSLNMLVFAVERGIATIWPTKYEKIKSGMGATVACSITTIVAILYTYICLASPNKYLGYWVACSIRTPENHKTYTLWITTTLIVELTTLLILIISGLITLEQRRRRKMDRSLGRRYQVNENCKILSLLLPCFIVHSALHLLTSFGVSIYNIYWPNFDPTRNTMVVEIFNQSMLYSLLMPIVLYSHRKWGRRKSVVDEHKTSETYFLLLRASWLK